MTNFPKGGRRKKIDPFLKDEEEMTGVEACSSSSVGIVSTNSQEGENQENNDHSLKDDEEVTVVELKTLTRPDTGKQLLMDEFLLGHSN